MDQNQTENKGNKTVGLTIAGALAVGLVTVLALHGQKTDTNTVLGDTTNTEKETPLGSTDGSTVAPIGTPGATSSAGSESIRPGSWNDEDDNESDEDDEEGSGSVVVTPPVTTGANATYRDGTYTTTVSYMSPGGMDKLGVSVTLKGGVVADTSVTNMAGNGTSSHYEDSFAQNYKSSVVGKSIATLSIGKVAGASLTTAAFNNALTTLRAQAKA